MGSTRLVLSENSSEAKRKSKSNRTPTPRNVSARMSGLGEKWLARGPRGWAIIPGDCWLLGVGGLGENACGDERYLCRC